MVKKPKRRARHIPKRTCVGCREVLPKRGLIRIVKGPEGVTVDPTGKLPGRGAYLHEKRSCWQRGLKGALGHALKTTLTDQDREALSVVMAALPEEDLGKTGAEELSE
jgi:uncharacterized protein